MRQSPTVVILIVLFSRREIPVSFFIVGSFRLVDDFMIKFFSCMIFLPPEIVSKIS